MTIGLHADHCPLPSLTPFPEQNSPLPPGHPAFSSTISQSPNHAISQHLNLPLLSARLRFFGLSVRDRAYFFSEFRLRRLEGGLTNAESWRGERLKSTLRFGICAPARGTFFFVRMAGGIPQAVCEPWDSVFVPLRVGIVFYERGGRSPPSAAAEPAALRLSPLRD
jgi:hypothetical protein